MTGNVDWDDLQSAIMLANLLFIIEDGYVLKIKA